MLVNNLFVPEETGAVLFTGPEWIILRWEVDEAVLKIPGAITIRGRRRYVLTSVPEVGDYIKEDMGFAGFEVVLNGDIYDLTALKSFNFMGVELGQSARLESSYKEMKGILRALKARRGTVFEIEDSDGMLASLGINRVVLTYFEVRQVKSGRWAYTLNMLPELLPEKELELFEYE